MQSSPLVPIERSMVGDLPGSAGRGPHHVPFIHVVTTSQSRLETTLRTTLWNEVRVSLVHTSADLCHLRNGGPVVVDLIDLPRWVRPDLLRPRADPRTWLLVVPFGMVDAGWLEYAGTATVVRCPPGDVRPVVRSVREKLQTVPGSRIAALVLEREPSLRAVDDLVAAICTHPWQVRRPKDLSRLSHRTPGRVKLACRALGFSRVEHFILAVRIVALEQLASWAGLSLKTARWHVGILDPSNARRQLHRAQRQSMAVFGRLTAAGVS